MIEGLLQPSHLLLILGVALLMFGPKKLPELGKGIGEGFRSLKEGMKEKPVETTNTAASTSAPTNPNTNTEAKS